MKIVCLVLGLCMAALNLSAQCQIVPAEVGQVAVLNEDSTTVLLKQEKAIVKSKNSPLMFVPVASLVAKNKLFYEFKGITSETVIKPQRTVLVARVSSTESEKDSKVGIVKFEEKKKSRIHSIVEGSALGGATVDGGYNNTEWKAQKLGNNAYIITFDTIEPGEYGIWIFDKEILNPDAKVSTFTVKE